MFQHVTILQLSCDAMKKRINHHELHLLLSSDNAYLVLLTFIKYILLLVQMINYRLYKYMQKGFTEESKQHYTLSHVESPCLALVQDISKHTSEPSALKWSRACFRISPFMEPSSRWKGDRQRRSTAENLLLEP